jgi:hypothetical protein
VGFHYLDRLMRRTFEIVLACVAGAVLIGALSAAAQKPDGAAERRQAIADCEANGGIPVPIAGILASRGIGCAQPMGF